MYKYRNLGVTKYPQSGFRIDTAEGTIVYIDPYKLPEGQPKADLIFISHEHFDHLDKESIKTIIKDDTEIFGNYLVSLQFKDSNYNFSEIRVYDEFEVDNILVHCKAAYNINKYKDNQHVFHPKENAGIGFLLTFQNTEDEKIKIYHMGDTDFLEVDQIVDALDILMIPVSGTYVMTPEEASRAINAIKPKVVIPMHYDAGIVGSSNDIDILRNNTDITIEALDAMT